MHALNARLVAVTVLAMSFVLFLLLFVYNRTNKKRRTLPDSDTYQKKHSSKCALIIMVCTVGFRTALGSLSTPYRVSLSACSIGNHPRSYSSEDHYYVMRRRFLSKRGLYYTSVKMGCQAVCEKYFI